MYNYLIETSSIGAVLVLHTPIIKYIFEIHLICIAVGKNGKEKRKGFKTTQVMEIQLGIIILHSIRFDTGLAVYFP